MNRITELDTRELQKPFLKWIGGKTQIIQQVLSQFPTTINNYHEPFLGGGSVLLAVLSLIKCGRIKLTGSIYASDLNSNLINVYRQLQTNPVNLATAVQQLRDTYHNLHGNVVNRKPSCLEQGTSSKESYYYWIRHQYNTQNSLDTIKVAAQFIFLNKTCFRGMYRVGPNGFNVPYGHYRTTPSMLTVSEANVFSDLLVPVQFSCQPFSDSIRCAITDDWVYLDPPYVPVQTTSFVGYNVDGFGLETHLELFTELKRLIQNQVRFAMSNSNVDLVVNEFTECQIHEIVARRAINSKNPGSKTTEVIITN